MKKNHFFCLVAVIAIIISCKKEDAKTNSSSIDGTYKFESISAKTNSTIIGNDGEKMVTISDYNSSDNKGTVVFDNGHATSKDLSYSVNSVATGYFYENGILTDSTSLPYSVTVPASNSVSTYKLVGADSIYFSQGGFVSIGSATATSNTGGGHYKISGNQLIFNLTGSKDSTFAISGVTFQMKESVIASVVLSKQ
jgi:hypothetical protein